MISLAANLGHIRICDHFVVRPIIFLIFRLRLRLRLRFGLGTRGRRTTSRRRRRRRRRRLTLVSTGRLVVGERTISLGDCTCFLTAGILFAPAEGHFLRPRANLSTRFVTALARRFCDRGGVKATRGAKSGTCARIVPAGRGTHGRGRCCRGRCCCGSRGRGRFRYRSIRPVRTALSQRFLLFWSLAREVIQRVRKGSKSLVVATKLRLISVGKFFGHAAHFSILLQDTFVFTLPPCACLGFDEAQLCCCDVTLARHALAE